MRLEYFARPSKDSGEIRYALGEGVVRAEYLTSGGIEQLELSQVSRVRLTTWHRKGCCVLIARNGKKIAVPSYSYTDSGSREDQVEEYTRFIDSLHEQLEILAPRAKYEGRSNHYILAGIFTVFGSLVLGSLFGAYFTMGKNLASGVEWYRWFLLTFGILATCGLVIGVSLFLKGLTRSYSPGMAPCYLLPISREPAVSVGTDSGRPASIQFYGHHQQIFPMTKNRAHRRGTWFR